jgi:hypothetical protein
LKPFLQEFAMNITEAICILEKDEVPAFLLRSKEAWQTVKTFAAEALSASHQQPQREINDLGTIEFNDDLDV